MAIWWLKVAEEIEVLRRHGVKNPHDFIPKTFSGNGDPPVIETTHRDVTGKGKQVVALRPGEVSRQPDGIDEKRFRDNERLVDNGKSESFLKRPIKKAGRWS